MSVATNIIVIQLIGFLVRQKKKHKVVLISSRPCLGVLSNDASQDPRKKLSEPAGGCAPHCPAGWVMVLAWGSWRFCNTSQTACYFTELSGPPLSVGLHLRLVTHMALSTGSCPSDLHLFHLAGVDMPSMSCAPSFSSMLPSGGGQDISSSAGQCSYLMHQYNRNVTVF